MKRLKVDTARAPAEPESPIVERTMYQVPLGNHVVLNFSSKRQALAWQAEATRQLTDMLMSCNLMLAEAFTAYRMAWPYFGPGDGLQRHVRDAEAAMDKATNVNGPNAIYMRWRAMDDALANIRAMALALAKMYADKSHAVPRHQCQVLAERCSDMRTALQQFGTDADRSKGYRPSPYSG
jgi:hypothetical protein